MKILLINEKNDGWLEYLEKSILCFRNSYIVKMWVICDKWMKYWRDDENLDEMQDK